MRDAETFLRKADHPVFSESVYEAFGISGKIEHVEIAGEDLLGFRREGDRVSGSVESLQNGKFRYGSFGAVEHVLSFYEFRPCHAELFSVDKRIAAEGLQIIPFDAFVYGIEPESFGDLDRKGDFFFGEIPAE